MPNLTVYSIKPDMLTMVTNLFTFIHGDMFPLHFQMTLLCKVTYKYAKTSNLSGKQGKYWQCRFCNAVFSVYKNINNIQEICKYVNILFRLSQVMSGTGIGRAV